MAALSHLINHAWQHLGPTWGARLTMGLGHTAGEGDMRSHHGTSEVQGEVGHSMRWEDEVPMCRMGGMEGHGGQGAGSEYGAG